MYIYMYVYMYIYICMYIQYNMYVCIYVCRQFIETVSVTAEWSREINVMISQCKSELDVNVR